MTLDKFGRHISKRRAIDVPLLQKNIFSDVENKIMKNFKSDVKKDIDNLNKRVNENDQNVQLQIKLLEDNFSSEFKDKITKIKDVVKKNDELLEIIYPGISRLENELKTMKQKFDDQIVINGAKIEIFVAQCNDLYKKLNYQTTENESNLKNLENKVLKEVKSLNEFVQTLDDVSRKEFNDTMSYAREELNAAMREIKKETIRANVLLETAINVKINELKNKVDKLSEKS